LATKLISKSTRNAGIENLYGKAGITNIQGEEVKKLDLLANNAFINALTSTERVCVLVSEEDDDALIIEHRFSGDYVITFDPLDGSSNIDANISIGSIFGIFLRTSPATQIGNRNDALQPGNKLIAAGYSLYGSSTMLVVSIGHGVDAFTLDNGIGEFILTHPNIRIPDRGQIYSINEGNSLKWDAPVRDYVQLCKTGGEDRKPYSLRYVGSMVADVHRTLLYGGIFMYPADSSAKNGKLRYLYEVAPISYIVEQAGGAATTGRERALDITPTSIHQRVPIFLGSKLDVEDVEKFFKNEVK